MMHGATAVLDIGKTNAKLSLLTEHGGLLAEQRCPNTILTEGPYPHHDTGRVWNWLLETLAQFAQQAEIAAIVPITHGATAALVDDAGLVLPVMDYESALPQGMSSDYAARRPPFRQTRSPDLPAGLNLGRQLYWQAQRFPAQFRRARHLLTYPQYWAWRLSGVAASEVTSLGCHTDLWDPVLGGPSSLAIDMGWHRLLPPLQAAWQPLGPVLPELAARIGLPPGCAVLCGIHDSNASLLRYLDRAAGSASGASRSVTVLSTGTWVIAAALGRGLGGLEEGADMLANVDALGRPVACMRFMGGREFAQLAGDAPQPGSLQDMARLIAQDTLALPCFAESGGPFHGRQGYTDGPAPRTAQERYALATLYCVLMTDYCLEALDSAGSIVIEGSFGANPLFAALLAATRAPQPVLLSDDASGTTCGGWLLHRRGGQLPHVLQAVEPAMPEGWPAYRARWRRLVRERPGLQRQPG
jgi:sugar (pentulose or hexulose) kinase